MIDTDSRSSQSGNMSANTIRGAQRLIEHVRNMQAVRMAVVHPCDALSLSSVIDARNAGIIVPVLVVTEAKLRTIARGAGIDLAGCEIIDVPHSHAAAAVAAP